MSTWKALYTDIERELLRSAQRVESHPIVGDRIVVDLPQLTFDPWRPVLDEVAREIGEALVKWSERQEIRWYGAHGPSVMLRLCDAQRPRVTCSFGVPDVDNQQSPTAL